MRRIGSLFRHIPTPDRFSRRRALASLFGQNHPYATETVAIQKLIEDIAVTKSALGVNSNSFVTGILPTASLQEAASFMTEREVGSLVVVDEGMVLGILTERDVVRGVMSECSRRDDDSEFSLEASLLTVEDMMTERVAFVDPTTPVKQALVMMRDNKCRHLPVVATSACNETGTGDAAPTIQLDSLTHVISIKGVLEIYARYMHRAASAAVDKATEATAKEEKEAAEAAESTAPRAGEMRVAADGTSVGAEASECAPSSEVVTKLDVAPGLVENAALSPVIEHLRATTPTVMTSIKRRQKKEPGAKLLNTFIEDEISVAEAAEEMLRLDCASVFVLSEDHEEEEPKLCGIFTERDFIRNVSAKGLDPRNTLVVDVATRGCAGPATTELECEKDDGHSTQETPLRALISVQRHHSMYECIELMSKQLVPPPPFQSPLSIPPFVRIRQRNPAPDLTTRNDDPSPACSDVRHLPVLDDEASQLIGIVSAKDVVDDLTLDQKSVVARFLGDYFSLSRPSG